MRPSLHRLARHVHTHRTGEGEGEEEEEEVGVEEVEGEEVKQHTRGCSTQKHRPGTSTLQGARSRTGNGPGGEVAYSLREELPWRLRCV